MLLVLYLVAGRLGDKTTRTTTTAAYYIQVVRKCEVDVASQYECGYFTPETQTRSLSLSLSRLGILDEVPDVGSYLGVFSAGGERLEDGPLQRWSNAAPHQLL